MEVRMLDAPGDPQRGREGNDAREDEPGRRHGRFG
jgi:hypothetical protein